MQLRGLLDTASRVRNKVTEQKVKTNVLLFQNVDFVFVLIIIYQRFEKAKH